MTAFIFAGQGAQYVGMGKDLYDNFPESKSIFERADKILGFSISGVCFAGPDEALKRTQNCQPAILTVSIAALEALKAFAGSRLQPAGYAAGLSLGEYSALVAAEVLSFEDALCLVKRRGEFMEAEALKKPGGMLSIIGMDLSAVKKICAQSGAEIANINCPGQVVISGGKKAIAAAAEAAQASGAKRVIELEVSGAFHSSFMEGAALKFAKELDNISIESPRIPVISNVTAKPENSAREIKDNLIRQVASPVLWEDSMKFILSKGVENFIEFGPGRVLKGLMRRIEPEALVTSVESKEDVVKF